ncbi:Spo0E family sporulation regulatory protein-aspartic acid phosphatase [Paenibacillus terreus]|uniref:Spo0E family sporulation regulatory protein-aspartic acid phosphatase n=1 Tax=Paenibacillus terreus TaxID=1387834 RepID=A0ABV5B7R7_9BACL
MMTAIMQQIEKERQKLHDLQAQFGTLDERVLLQSMLLDELINKYYRIRTAEQRRCSYNK